MMRLLVTGGAGFIGSHLVRALAEAGEQVTVLDNLRRGRREAVHPGARFLEGDIRSASTLADACRNQEVVYHLAAQSNVLGAVHDVDYSFTTNVTGTFELLKAAKITGVRKLVFASSREVYGEQLVLPVSETARTGAKNAYGASKLAAEAYCCALTADSDLECAVLRLANVYGPGDHDRVIPLWIDRAVRGEELIIYGGQQVLDFVPVETVVAAMRAAAAEKVDGPVNVGSGRGTPLVALAERIRALSGSRVATVIEPARAAEVVRFVADTTRMRDVLGVIPPADPLRGLPELWEAARSSQAAA